VDALAFTVFLFLVGRLGEGELAATSITFTLNLVAALPMVGLGQAVGILVGQRLGEDQPGLAGRTTWTGLAVALAYMTAVALVYVLLPGPLVGLFHSDVEPVRWAHVAALVPVLLRFVAVYSLFDAMTLTVSFALRGAGDTRFVTAAAVALSWPVMVVPAWAAWQFGWGLYWAWAFASAYIVLLALTMLLRFRQGKWRTMRVIEAPAAAAPAALPSLARHHEREREDVRLQ